MLKQRRAGAAIVLTLDDPGRRNILSGEMCAALSAAIAAANGDEDCKAIVLTGAGAAFCAGADLADLQAAADGDTATLHAVYGSFMAVADSRLPTIAAVNGAAIGAGFNLALACDIRIAAQGALFDTRFLRIGLHPGGGHGWMLLRAVGWAEAARLLLLGRPVAAPEALAMGLVQEVVPAERLVEAALALAGGAEALPRALIVAAKQSMRHAAAADHAASFAQEAEAQLRSLQQAPFRELVKRLRGEITRR